VTSSRKRGQSGLLGALTEGLVFLWAINPAEANTFGVLVVQDFEGVAVEDMRRLIGVGLDGIELRVKEQSCSPRLKRSFLPRGCRR